MPKAARAKIGRYASRRGKKQKEVSKTSATAAHYSAVRAQKEGGRQLQDLAPAPVGVDAAAMRQSLAAVGPEAIKFGVGSGGDVSGRHAALVGKVVGTKSQVREDCHDVGMQIDDSFALRDRLASTSSGSIAVTSWNESSDQEESNDRSNSSNTASASGGVLTVTEVEGTAVRPCGTSFPLSSGALVNFYPGGTHLYYPVRLLGSLSLDRTVEDRFEISLTDERGNRSSVTMRIAVERGGGEGGKSRKVIDRVSELRQVGQNLQRKTPSGRKRTLETATLLRGPAGRTKLERKRRVPQKGVEKK